MKVRSKTMKAGILALLLLGAAGIAWTQTAMELMPGMIDGVEPADDLATGEKVFLLTARTGYITTPEGGSVFLWGFTVSGSNPATELVQYPGPTLLLKQGDKVRIDLTNKLPVNVSMVFPGQSGVVATQLLAPTADGLLTKEANPLQMTGAGTVIPAGKVRYTFTVGEPGTYLYYSGTRPDLQVDMGLFGAIIVRPANFDVAVALNRKAYNHDGSRYDVEYLFLESELDPKIHRQVQYGWWNQVDTAAFFPTYWFLNGRAAPDTMYPAYAEWLPTQPYNCMPMMKPGQKLLMRVVNAGRDLHPYHQHGNHAQVIARDARLLDGDALSTVIDQAFEVFTFQSVPGQTMDGIFTWTGAGIGWDIYGHTTNSPATLEPWEDPNDHGKPFPVMLPELQDLTFGGWWSGSPFLGSMGALPPGEGGMNPMSGFVYMWHSHTEKEMVNNDIFPGGMMTMLIIEPPGPSAMGMNNAQGSIELLGGAN